MDYSKYSIATQQPRTLTMIAICCPFAPKSSLEPRTTERSRKKASATESVPLANDSDYLEQNKPKYSTNSKTEPL